MGEVDGRGLMRMARGGAGKGTLPFYQRKSKNQQTF